VHLTLGTCVIRDWLASDATSLARHANDRQVWINLRDKFPHPYNDHNARQFLDYICQHRERNVWAIEVDGEAAGGIGFEPLTDIERVSAEIGYWLGRQYWGRGIMTDALRSITTDAFERLDLSRIFALPFADNHGSIRVLEKVGYVVEGRLRHSAIKDGVLRDQVLFATYRDAWPSLASRPASVAAVG
jgi:RimJ/RimL family protein N-acetyltransferase